MMSSLPNSQPSSEDGFTLVELIIALGIGGLLIWATATALIIGLRTTEETGDQVSDAAWARIVGTWFLTDVQGAEYVGVETCGVPPGSLVESFTRSRAVAGPPQERHAVWWLAGVGAGETTAYDLRRTECGSGPTATAVIAEGIQDLRIVCEESPIEIAPGNALQCTLAWTTTPGVPVSTWPYRLTAARRTG